MNEQEQANLTAYALGELQGDAAAEMEKRVREDPEARAAVDRVRNVAGQLREQLQAEPAAEMTAAQQRRLAAPARRPIRIVFRTALAAAAAALIAVGLWGYVHTQNALAEQDLQLSQVIRERDELAAKLAGTKLQRFDRSASMAPGYEDGGTAEGLTADGRRKDLKDRPGRDRPKETAAVATGTTAGPGGKNVPGAPKPQNQPTAPADTAGDHGAPVRTETEGKVGDKGTKADLGLSAAKKSLESQSAAAPAKAPAPGAAGPVVAAGRERGYMYDGRSPRGLGKGKGRVGGGLERSRLSTAGAVAGDGKRLRPDAEKLERDADDYRQAGDKWNREMYDHIVENPFRSVSEHPLSTFSIDVDTASYANVRRMLNAGQLPPAGAVRIEEMVNYFNYDYIPPAPKDEGEKAAPFAAHLAVSACPWQPKHRVVRVAVKGYEVSREERPPANLVFLLDVSGSMRRANKLPLVIESMKLLVRQLKEDDRIAIAVYAGKSGLVLDSTPISEKEKIIASLSRLRAGGSTNGGAGIRLAYSVAKANFIKGGVNRVILCTDGDFNVGTTSQSELVTLIKEKAKTGVFLTVLGFGMGNYQDSRLEKIADKGNGAYGYIDSKREAHKHFVEELSGSLVTIAKDVKIQVEFNPARVAGYRLIGYENRMLRKEDFNDDKKDAGEIGAGHTVTALYEVVPAGQKVPSTDVDELKYQTPAKLTDAAASGELLTLKMRYKAPDGDKSSLLMFPLKDGDAAFGKADEDFRFAASVAAFGMILRDSQYKGAWSLGAVLETAEATRGKDPHGHRAEFVELVRKAKALKQK